MGTIFSSTGRAWGWCWKLQCHITEINARINWLCITTGPVTTTSIVPCGSSPNRRTGPTYWMKRCLNTMGAVYEPVSLKINDMDQLLVLHHTALRIRSDIQASPSHSDCTSINADNAAKLVSESLFMLLSVLLTGEHGAVDERTRRLSLSIVHYIVHAVSKGNVVTPKHIGLGMTIHQATRSIEHVNHKAWHCINYSQVERLDTTLAKYVLDNLTERGNFQIPPNLVEEKFLQFSADNIDIIEETLDGQENFHSALVIGFQRGIPRRRLDQELRLRSEGSLKVPLELQQLKCVPDSGTRAQPHFHKDVIMANYKPDATMVKNSKHQRCCMSSSQALQQSQQSVPAWTGFNQHTIKDTTTMGYLPIINTSAHERDTLWIVIARCSRITHELNAGQATVLTFNEQLYAKVKELQWENPDTNRSLFVRLGGFHIAKNLMKVIGQH